MRLTAAIIAFLLTVSLTPDPAAAKLHFGPYLQSLSPSETAICFFIDPGDQVEILLQTGSEKIQKNTTGTRPACVSFKGLIADEVYTYEILLNQSPVDFGAQLSFVAHSKDDATLVIYGDTRSGDDSFDLTHARIVRAINETVVPDAIIHTGDYVEQGGREELVANFFRIERDLVARAPIFPTIGQSDQPPELMRSVYPLLTKKPWYSFDWAGAHFVICNLWKTSRQDKDETSSGGSQAKWLRNDLADAKARGIQNIFAVVHEPVIDANGNIPKALREVFMPIFEEFGVKAVFSGAHYFSHTTRNNVQYFTNGGGGALLDASEPKEGIFRYFSAVHHFLIMEIDRTGIQVKVIDSHGSEFYEAVLDGDNRNSSSAASSFVESYGEGERSAAISVYYRNRQNEVDPLAELLDRACLEAGAVVVATYRHLEHPENRASLENVADRREPLPIVVSSGTALYGMDEIELKIDSLIADALRSPIRNFLSPQWIIIAGAIIAGMILFFWLCSFQKKRKHQDRQTS
jgi:Calcineurin-like phosphoesterase